MLQDIHCKGMFRDSPAFEERGSVSRSNVRTFHTLNFVLMRSPANESVLIRRPVPASTLAVRTGFRFNVCVTHE
jgi:hypothetical protein